MIKSPMHLAQPSLTRRLPESNRCRTPLGQVTVQTPKPDLNRHGYVYVAEAKGGRVKIGWSQDPLNRLRLLESETCGYVHLWALIPGTPALEGEIHARWSHLHVEGEWFRADEELLTWAEGFDPSMNPKPLLVPHGIHREGGRHG